VAQLLPKVVTGPRVLKPGSANLLLLYENYEQTLAIYSNSGGDSSVDSRSGATRSSFSLLLLSGPGMNSGIRCALVVVAALFVAECFVPHFRLRHRTGAVFALFQRSWLDQAADFFDKKNENDPVPLLRGGDCSSDLLLSSSSLSGNAETVHAEPAGMHREAEGVDQELLLKFIEAQLVQDILAIGATGCCQCAWVDLFDTTRHFAVEPIFPFQVERGGLMRAWEDEDSA
jgi:hypothetical protein